MIKDMIREEARRELLRRRGQDSFWHFCLYTDEDFFTRREDILREYIQHLDDIAHAKVSMGHAVNVAMPRRTGKSYVINLFIIWWLGRDASIMILRATYNADMAKQMHNEVRSLMNSETYKATFPLAEVTMDNASEIRMKGNTRINFKTVSVGGAATGGGADIVIADDLYKNETEAMSEAKNREIQSWFYSAFISSLEGQYRYLAMVGTRWRVGEITDKVNFDKKIILRALTPEGRSFHEDVIPTDKLLDMKESMHESLFMAMYQQEPMIAKGALIRHGDFVPIEEEDFEQLKQNGGIIERIALVDNKTTGTDFYAAPIIAITRDHQLILEDVIYTNDVMSDELEAVVARTFNHYGVDTVYFETNNDHSHFRNMRKIISGNARSFKTRENKEVKILTNAYKIKGMRVRWTNDKAYNGFINDVCKYDVEGKNKHDDAIDSLVMVIQHIERKYRRR